MIKIAFSNFIHTLTLICVFRGFRKGQEPSAGSRVPFASSNFWSFRVNRNGLYLIIGALIVVVAGFAIYTYQEESKPSGIEMKIGEGGVSIQEN